MSWSDFENLFEFFENGLVVLKLPHWFYTWFLDGRSGG